MNIFLHEFKLHLRSVWVWSVSIAILLFVFMSISTNFAENSALFNEMLSNFPQQLLMAFGMQDIDFSSVLGYFGLIFLFCQICLAIQASNYGVGLVSIEETEYTADFLLTRPVSRPTIMTSKLLAALAALAVTNVVVWIASFTFISTFGKGAEIDLKPLIIVLSSIFLLQLFFLAVGMLISLLVRRVRSVIPISMGLVFGLYILNVFGDMIGKKGLEVISPFQHFDPSYIVKHSAINPLAWISVVVALVSLAASYVLYQRRNIHSAV